MEVDVTTTHPDPSASLGAPRPVERFRSALRAAWARFKLRRCAAVGAGAEVVGRVWIHGGGEVRIGRQVRFEAGQAPIELNVARGAELVIGDAVWIASGTSVEAMQRVVIGDRCHLSGFCKIMDNSFHVPGAVHVRPPSAPVEIEADVWIGRRAVILPGALVRRGATVRAGTVVRGRGGALPATRAAAERA